MPPGFYSFNLEGPRAGSEYQMRVVGALSAELPEGFESRLAIALRDPEKNLAELNALKSVFMQARKVSSEKVKEIVQSRARQIAEAIQNGQDIQNAASAAEDLGAFRIYGPMLDSLVREVRSVVIAARYDRTMDRAQERAARLLRTLSAEPLEEAVVAGAAFSNARPQLARPTRKPTVLSDDQLNLTAEHYANARKLYSELFSVRPKIAIEPLLNGSGEKTLFIVGDEVKLGISTFYVEQNAYLYKYFIEGKVEALILDGTVLVGLAVQRHDVNYPDDIHTPPTDIVWLKDVDPQEAHVLRRESAKAAASNEGLIMQAAAIPEPETSFPILFPYGKKLMSPLAVGDEVVFSFKEFNGRTILVASVSAGNGRKIEALIHDELGNPIGFKYKYAFGDSGDDIYEYDKSRISADGMVSIYFREILRSSSPRLDTGSPQYLSFRFPKSRGRIAGQADTYSWLPAIGSSIRQNDDSGDFTLRVGASTFFGEDIPGEGDFQAPVSVGDELLLSIKKPGTLLGFSYDRYLVLEVLKRADGKPYGFRTERLGSGDPTSIVVIEDFNRDDSYIETKPWSAMANKTPGAWAKKTKYIPVTQEGFREHFDPRKVAEFMAGLFGRAGADRKTKAFRDFFENSGAAAAPDSGKAMPAWEKAPVSYKAWRVRFLMRENEANAAQWARWVFQVHPAASKDEIKNRSKALYMHFHPDLAAGRSAASEGFDREEVSKIIGEAKRVLLHED